MFSMDLRCVTRLGVKSRSSLPRLIVAFILQACSKCKEKTFECDGQNFDQRSVHSDKWHLKITNLAIVSINSERFPTAV
jgi:hypothetical protein